MKKRTKILLSSMIAILLVFGTTLNFSEAASTSTTKTIKNLEKQVKNLTSSNKKKDKEIKNFKAQVKEKDKKIQSLNSSINTKNKEINSLKTKVKELENQSTPTTPGVGEIGKSRDNAAKINQTVLINNNDRIYGLQKFELTLTEVISGKEALNMIKATNQFNSSPDSGMKYVLAKIKIKTLKLDKEPMDMNHSLFKAVSKNGVMYTDFVSIVPPKPNLRTSLYSGSEFEGWTYFMVNETDSPKVVFKDGYASETWFDLGL